MGRIYGAKYNKALSTREVAARMRADVKNAIRGGELPPVRVSVALRRSSLSSSIDLRVTKVPEGFPVVNESAWRFLPGGRYEFVGVASERYAPELAKVLTWLGALHAAYNYDGSDAMTDSFDVNYYGSVQVDPDVEGEALERAAKRRGGQGAPSGSVAA